MKKAFGFLRKNPEIIFFICIFLLWTAFMCNENAKEGGDFSWHDLKVEANGMIFDLFVFGILVTTYNAIRARKEKIERLKEEIDDYRSWEEKEATFRIIGAVKRLQKLRVFAIDLSKCFLKSIEIQHGNFSDAKFQSTNLQGARFYWTSFKGVEFRWSNLEGAMFIESNLDNSRFEYAKLKGTNFKGSDLCHSNFKLVDIMEWVNFENANLEQSDFSRVKASNVKFSNTNMRKAILTDACFNDSVFENVELENARVGSNWFDKLQTWNIEDLEEIKAKYFIDDNGIIKLK